MSQENTSVQEERKSILKNVNGKRKETKSRRKLSDKKEDRLQFKNTKARESEGNKLKRENKEYLTNTKETKRENREYVTNLKETKRENKDNMTNSKEVKREKRTSTRKSLSSRVQKNEISVDSQEKRETRKKDWEKENNSIFKKSKLKIIPLGGLHEVGKNITVFEYEDEIIVVDCGLSFPEDDMLGIDLVIPDISYLVKNQEKIKGMIITHGHEDHIGSIPYFLKQINVPIYAPRLAVGLIKNKLEEHKLLRSTKLVEVVQGQTISLGKYFNVEFIRSTHSIPDSVMLAITTPVGTILHTGDFKMDYTPIDGKMMDLGRIAELGNQGILALMSDSTNAVRKGFTIS